MNQDIKNKIEQELEHFTKKIESGFDPYSAFAAMLPRILKEQDMQTREHCASFILATHNNIELSEAVKNLESFPEVKKPKM